VPEKMLDKYRELEKATGFKMKDIGFNEQSLAFYRFMDGDIQDIPHFDNDFVKSVWNIIDPQNYGDLLRLIGFAHSTNVWNNNAETLFDEHKMSLREIPAYREDLYEMISEKLYKKGIYDNGLAYEVADKTMRGYYARTGGIDEDIMLALLDLGFDIDFIYFLSNINYMFTKAHGIAYLREAIAMMFYKTKFNKEYSEIMLVKMD
jgi:DNA polymerase III alpha subunit (gram-positive type)